MFKVVKTTPFIHHFRSISVGIFAVGGMIGGLAAGWFADKLGRRNAILFNNAILFCGTAFMTVAKKFTIVYYLITIGRFIVGVNCGKIYAFNVNKC